MHLERELNLVIPAGLGVGRVELPVFEGDLVSLQLDHPGVPLGLDGLQGPEQVAGLVLDHKYERHDQHTGL